MGITTEEWLKLPEVKQQKVAASAEVKDRLAAELSSMQTAGQAGGGKGAEAQARSADDGDDEAEYDSNFNEREEYAADERADPAGEEVVTSNHSEESSTPGLQARAAIALGNTQKMQGFPVKTPEEFDKDAQSQSGSNPTEVNEHQFQDPPSTVAQEMGDGAAMCSEQSDDKELPLDEMPDGVVDHTTASEPVYFIFEDNERHERERSQFRDKKYLQGDRRKFTRLVYVTSDVAAPWVRPALKLLEERLRSPAAIVEQVCFKFYYMAYGISYGYLHDCRKRVLKGRHTFVHELTYEEDNRKISLKRESVVAWLKKYADEYGQPQPDKAEKHLSDGLAIEELWDEYIEGLQENEEREKCSLSYCGYTIDFIPPPTPSIILYFQ
ncbi:hypothetical protein CYMTET_9384 [Cymbomonas tetramitiformis]|uniref:Uncharacterized protein n=1 Tax=Cymbomonas tetramitiformis TaxID=36881 RepID=A0AAE0GR52_9CHLO|nr:hypothetical protein CYMTET_9384 [Cymbomonas tetramitiformis]